MQFVYKFFYSRYLLFMGNGVVSLMSSFAIAWVLFDGFSAGGACDYLVA